MRKIIEFFILCILSLSCVSSQNIDEKNIIGVFYYKKLSTKKEYGFEYTLNIKNENKFHMIHKVYGGSPTCSGSWYINNGVLFLNCADTESLTDKLSSAYMNQRHFKVQILNKNKLVIENNIVLKRK